MGRYCVTCSVPWKLWYMFDINFSWCLMSRTWLVVIWTACQHQTYEWARVACIKCRLRCCYSLFPSLLMPHDTMPSNTDLHGAASVYMGCLQLNENLLKLSWILKSLLKILEMSWISLSYFYATKSKFLSSLFLLSDVWNSLLTDSQNPKSVLMKAADRQLKCCKKSVLVVQK